MYKHGKVWEAGNRAHFYKLITFFFTWVKCPTCCEESKVKLRWKIFHGKKRKKKGKKKSICQHWQTFRILWEYKYILWYDLVSWVCACVDWQETEDCFTLKHRQCSELYNEWVCVRALVCGGLGMFQRVSAHGHTLKHSAGAVLSHGGWTRH